MRKKTRTHGCTETAIDLENSKLVEILVAIGCGESVVGNNLISGG